MTEKFLYEELDTLSLWEKLNKEIPNFLKNNLNPKFEKFKVEIDKIII